MDPFILGWNPWCVKINADASWWRVWSLWRLVASTVILCVQFSGMITIWGQSSLCPQPGHCPVLTLLLAWRSWAFSENDHHYACIIWDSYESDLATAFLETALWALSMPHGGVRSGGTCMLLKQRMMHDVALLYYMTSILHVYIITYIPACQPVSLSAKCKWELPHGLHDWCPFMWEESCRQPKLIHLVPPFQV